MATAEQLNALLKSYSEGDDERFYAVAMQVAAHSARQGHGKLAQEMRELIDAAKAKGGPSRPLGAAPVSTPRPPPEPPRECQLPPRPRSLLSARPPSTSARSSSSRNLLARVRARRDSLAADFTSRRARARTYHVIEKLERGFPLRRLSELIPANWAAEQAAQHRAE